MTPRVHPVLPVTGQIALTLRVVGGLTSEQIAHAFLVPTATIQQRIVRAKKTLATANVRFEIPDRTESEPRLADTLMPHHQDPHALVALLEFQSSRFDARVDPDGQPIALDRQDRWLWDADAIQRGNTALERADRQGRALTACGAAAGGQRTI